MLINIYYLASAETALNFRKYFIALSLRRVCSCALAHIRSRNVPRPK